MVIKDTVRRSLSPKRNRRGGEQDEESDAQKYNLFNSRGDSRDDDQRSSSLLKRIVPAVRRTVSRSISPRRDRGKKYEEKHEEKDKEQEEENGTQKYDPPNVPGDNRDDDQASTDQGSLPPATITVEQFEMFSAQMKELYQKSVEDNKTLYRKLSEDNKDLYEKANKDNMEIREQVSWQMTMMMKNMSERDPPEPPQAPTEDQGFYDLSHDSTNWRVSGYLSPAPIPDKCYFPGLIWKQQDAELAAIGRPNRVISGIIPCFNERGVDLERTIRSLRRQRMPSGFRVEFIIVMDGVDHMDTSMSEYLDEKFGVKVNSGDQRRDPFSIFPDANIVVVQPLDEESALKRTRAFDSAVGGYTLVLKKTNHRKANSQMWWLGSHASDIKCEYTLATDCGTVFHPMATVKLLHRMDNEHDLQAVTGFQRIMTAHMQGDGHFELLHSPQQFLLRMVQRFEFEVDHVSFKAIQDSIGYMSVIPGPCGLYRYSQFGNLKEGMMREYFRIFQRQSQGLILGNVEIVEDRIPGTMLVFPITRKSEKEETVMPRTGWPRTGFVYDALFFVEAEKPLSQLVKQRRRWLNGTFATYIWILKEGIITRANQDKYIKVLAMTVVIIHVIQGMVVRMCGPALLIVWMFRFGLFLPDLFSDPANLFDPTIGIIDLEEEPLRLWGGIAMGGGYLLLYIAFVIGHTPRAKPVQGAGELTFVRYTEPTKYASDKASAYRGWLFQPVLWLSSIVILLYILNAIGIVTTLGWYGTPIIVRILILVCALPFVLGLLDGFIRCNFKNFFGMVFSAPLAMPLIIWFTIWLPAYASTRLSDLTWGNRDSSGFDESEKALQRAEHGRRFATFLIVSNAIIAFVVIGLMHVWGETFPIFVLSYTIVMSCTYIFVIMDLIYRFIACAGEPACGREDYQVQPKKEEATVAEEEDSSAPFTEYTNMEDATAGMEVFLCGNAVVKADAATTEAEELEDMEGLMGCVPMSLLPSCNYDEQAVMDEEQNDILPNVAQHDPDKVGDQSGSIDIEKAK